MAERVSFDRIADAYDETRGLPATPMAKAIGFLAEELQGKHVLEIGVGTGRYAVPLQKSGVKVVGVDIATRMVERGLEKGLRDIVFADGARLPFRDGSFDAVTSNHVLHLVPDWRTVLREAERVLRPRGVYFSLFERYKDTTLADEYRALLRAFGYGRTDPGLHERNLPRLIPPARVVRVAHWDDIQPADKILEEMKRKLYAFMWKVPDDLHEKALSVLAAEHGGKLIDRTFDLEVAFWSRDQLGPLGRAPLPRGLTEPPQA